MKKNVLKGLLLSTVLMFSGAALADALPYDQVSGGFTGPVSSKINDNFAHVHGEIQALQGVDVGARVTTLEATTVTDTELTDSVAAFQASFDAKFDTVNANLAQDQADIEDLMGNQVDHTVTSIGVFSSNDCVISAKILPSGEGEVQYQLDSVQTLTDVTNVSVKAIGYHKYMLTMEYTGDEIPDLPIVTGGDATLNKCLDSNPLTISAYLDSNGDPVYGMANVLILTLLSEEVVKVEGYHVGGLSPSAASVPSLQSTGDGSITCIATGQPGFCQ